MTWNIPLFKIYSDEEDSQRVGEVINSGMYWAEGPQINEFENRISEFFGTEYCLVFNNGTSALHAALLAHGISPGDEVIVPSFTFISTANAALFVGAKPVFADIEEKTFGLDPADVAEKISNKTKAIIPVHYGGCPCRIRELREIADDNGLILIEDAAESFGAKISTKRVGTYGDSAMLSFCQNKIITTGEGGAIITDNRDLFEQLKLIRSHGRLDTVNYFSSNLPTDYVSLGYNFRMSSITAALGIAQLNKVDKIIGLRKKNAEYYTKCLRKYVKEVITPLPPKGYDHVYQLYTIRAPMRDGLMKFLAERGIMTKVYFNPVHESHYYQKNLNYSTSLPVTESISGEVLTLPMYPALTMNEMDFVTAEIKNKFEESQ